MVTQIPHKLTLSLGLFSGSSLSACWISVNTRDFVGAVSVGTAACAIILILLRYEAGTRRTRRRSDNDGEAASA
jgi:uncharacterized protein (DUF2062 family)